MSKSQHYSLPFDFDGAHKNKDKKKNLTTSLFTWFDYKWTPKKLRETTFLKVQYNNDDRY